MTHREVIGTRDELTCCNSHILFDVLQVLVLAQPVLETDAMHHHANQPAAAGNDAAIPGDHLREHGHQE